MASDSKRHVEIPDLDTSALPAPSGPPRRPSGDHWSSVTGASSAQSARVSNAPAEPPPRSGPRAATLDLGPASGLEGYFGTANFDLDHFGDDGGEVLTLETTEPLELPPGLSSPPPTSLRGPASAPSPASLRGPASAPSPASLRGPASAPSPASLRGPASALAPTKVEPWSSPRIMAAPAASQPPASLPAGPIPATSQSPVSRRSVGGDLRVWPTGETPPSEALPIDHASVVALAGHGDAPGGALLAPLYSARVLRRRRHLRARALELAVAFQDAETARDALLAELAAAARDRMPEGSPGAKLYLEVTEKEQRAKRERDALVATSEEHRERVAALAAEEAHLERALTDARAAVAERQRAVADAERSAAREEAKKKRLYIELSGIVDRVERSGAPPSAEDARQVARLEAAIAAHQPDLERALGVHRDARAALAAVQAEERRHLGKRRDCEKRRRAVDAEFERRLGRQNLGAGAAQREAEVALASVARAILAARGRLAEVDDATLAAIERADALVVERAIAVEQHVRALDAHDQDTYRRGFVVAGAALLAVAMVVLLVARL